MAKADAIEISCMDSNTWTPRQDLYSVCIIFNHRVSVCFLLIYSGRQACGRNSRGHTGGRSHTISHPPSFGGACLNFSREKDSAVPFPRRL